MIGILLTLILMAQGIPVQQGGTVTGVLRDSQGVPLAGVRMAAVARGDSLAEAATGAAMAGLAETDEQGRFTMENIPPGRYSIAAGRLDLQTYYPGTQSLADATTLTITPGATLSGINFVLHDASVGRAPGGGGPVPNITALIPVRVVVDKGKLPISANGTFITLRLEFGGGILTIPIDGASFSIPGPIATDVRVVVENLPDSYEVKSITYGSTPIPQGIFRLTSANFPTRLVTTVATPPPTPPPAPTPVPTPVPPVTSMVWADGTVSFIAWQSASNIIFASTTLRPAATPPSALSITIGESARPSTGGVRVSGIIGSGDKRRVYISGKPGTVFSDGTFEFQGVQPGRHLIASVPSALFSLGNSNPFASVVVVGDQDLSSVALEETLMLPPEAREPRAPMPAGSYAPGTIVGLARITGSVIEEITRTPILEGNLTIRAGDSSRTIRIDDKGRFESFYLLPGTYDLLPQIFGHSTLGPSITVEDKDINLEVTSRRLY